MSSDFYGFEEDEGRGQGRDHLFLWTVFILLLIGVAFACWLGSFYIFGHPEQPRSYAILKKLKKIDPPKRFEVTQAPLGDFMSPQKLFEKYSKFERLQLANENAELLRNYIKNYKEAKKLVPYVTGRFEIVDTYELKPTDIVPSGIVAVAVADEYSQVVIEHVFTTAPEDVKTLKSNLPRGLDMRLERTRDLAAVIHIERTDDGRMLFTVMPLLYGTWGVKGSIGSFSLQPPQELNLKAGVPIMRGEALVGLMKTYAEYRRSKAPEAAATDANPAPAGPELVRVDAVQPGTSVPETGALPVMPVATPIPVPGSKTQRPPSMLALRATPMAPPRGLPATPARTLAATPAATAIPAPPQFALNVPLAAAPGAAPLPPEPAAPPAVARPGVPLKPFIGSTTIMPQSGGNWRTYARGQHPPGRSITSSEAITLADRGGEIAERLYLRGDFVVTASGEFRAVLRAADRGDSARIIVEFPRSAPSPPQGSTVTRDDGEGFEVREVRRGQDGQINIYVREISGE